MPDPTPIAITPERIGLDNPIYDEIVNWSFSESYIAKLLSVWIYRDPSETVVGFGTIDVCSEYKSYTSGQLHAYLPLLAVNPSIKSLGYGTSIVNHLIAEAARMRIAPNWIHELVFLDVYESNEKAISVYKKCGFVPIISEPIPDANEQGRLYIVMAL